ncbi:MAG: sugar phosphorylase [Spirochaetes bacterium]|nr:sugar phosphorylase [Spirochaetota bacterium]
MTRSPLAGDGACPVDGKGKISYNTRMNRPLPDKMLQKLRLLYGEKRAETISERLADLIARYEKKIPKKRYRFTEKDSVLITYGDSFLRSGEKPLRALFRFLDRHLRGIVSTVHILPFFPYSSDDGFSVIDYKRVDPDLGDWEDIDDMGKHFKLMFDAVINHISKKSEPFLGFLRGDERFSRFFIVPDERFDLSRVFRPRALPLLTEFETAEGVKKVWTTFSADQVDLNFKNPEVLLYIIDVLLFYVSHGVSVIRLDAIAYLWKESKTSCLHLPQTHTVVKLFRDIFDLAAPHVKIITETNVPHEENISYFGGGTDEAHMVYNFALPPLSAHALITGDAKSFSRWARTLDTAGEHTCFYNFTASHDGVGMLPATGLISQRRIDELAERALERGGRLGYKSNPDGTKTVYELNISLFDLLSDPASDEPLTLKVDRFVASQGIALALKGVPAVYYHSLVGSKNYTEGVEKTGMNRTINREKLSCDEIEKELATPGTRRNLVFNRLARLITQRSRHPAFHPEGAQRVIELHDEVFAVERRSPCGKEVITVLVNCAPKEREIERNELIGTDLLTGRRFSGKICAAPFEILWLQRSPRSS